MPRTALALLGLAAIALAAHWNLALNTNLTVTQNAYSDNWAGTETGLFSWTFGTDFLAEKALSSIMNSRNTAKLALGYTVNQDTTRKWTKPNKSTDLIDLESVLRFTLGAWVDPFASVRLESQFADASDATLMRYVNPLKLTEGFGVARVFVKRPKSELVSKFGGAFKQTIDRDVLIQPLILPPLRHTVFDNYGGLLFTTDYNTPLFGERVTYTTKFSVFQAVFFSGAAKLSGDTASYWKQPDVNWENTFSVGITKLLMVNLYAQLLYDREVAAKARFKETLALGLTYRLI
jgi:hypothetical protein